MLFGTRAAADAAETVAEIAASAATAAADAADAAGDTNATIADIAADAIAADATAKEPTSLLLVPEGMEGIAVLPESLATVPAYAFSRCAKLSAISLSGSTGASFSCQDGILYTADATELLAAPAGIGATVAIAASCERIAKGALYGNIDLKTIAVAGFVTTIAEDAFSQRAIEGATVILNIDPADRDAAKAVWEAVGFTNFADPVAPGTTIEPTEGSGFAFQLLDDYTLAVRWSGIDPAPAQLEVPAYGLIEGVQYKVSSIADAGFANQTDIQQVELPDGLTSIGEGAFEGATELNTIAIPGSVAIIGAKAFADCDSLVALSLSEGLRTIGDEAFAGIAQMSVVLPASVKAVGDYAFANSPNLQTVVALGTVDEVGSNALAGATGLNLYVPYNEAEDYAWSAGLPASGNHLMPYGVKLTEEVITVKADEDPADLFADGYLMTPGDFQVNYSYKAKPISISDEGLVEAKEDGSSNVEVTLTLNVPTQVVNGIVNKSAKLTPAAYNPNSVPTVRVADIVESVQPVSLSATATVQSEARATGKTLSFRTTSPTAKLNISSGSLSDTAYSITLENVTSLIIQNDNQQVSTSSWGYAAYVSGTIALEGSSIDNISGSWTITSEAGLPISSYGGSQVQYGWGLDPSSTYDTLGMIGTNTSANKINAVPDGGTLWLILGNYRDPGSSGHILDIVSDDHSTMTYSFYNLGTYPSGSPAGTTTTMSAGESKRLYGVSCVQKWTDNVLIVNASPNSNYTNKWTYVFTVTANTGYTAYGFTLDSSLYSKSATIQKKGIEGYCTITDDQIIRPVVASSSGYSIGLNNNGLQTTRTYSSGDSYTNTANQTYSGITRIRVVSSVDSPNVVDIYNASGLYVTVTYPGDAPLAWIWGSREGMGSSSSIGKVSPMVTGTYYLTSNDTLKAIWSNGTSSTTGAHYGSISGYNDSISVTYDGKSEAMASYTLTQISIVNVLNNGTYEIACNDIRDTLGTRSSRLFTISGSHGVAGLSVNSTGSSITASKVLYPRESYIVSSDVNLYPFYKNPTYSLSMNLPYYNVSGYTTNVSPTSVSVSHGGTPTSSLTTVPSISGFTFNGFYTSSANPTGSDYRVYLATGAADTNFKWNYPETHRYIYASWTSHNVTVKFNGNGSTGGSTADKAMDIIRYNSGTTFNLPSNGFTRTNYTFKGWATSAARANAGTVDYSDQANMLSYLRSTTAVSNTLNLYAVWSRDMSTYYVNHMVEMADGTYVLSETVTSDPVGAGTSISPETAAATGTISYTDIYDRSTSQGTTANQTVASNGSTTFNIYWDRKAYTVTYAFNESAPQGAVVPAPVEVKWGATVTLPTPEAVAGYIFNGWKVEEGSNTLSQPGQTLTMPQGDKTITGTWKAGYVDVPINYYLQNADDDGYTFSESHSRTQACVVGQSYGPDDFGQIQYYTRNMLKGDVFAKTIAGDGSTEFNIYWDRNKYSVTFGFSGDVPEGEEAPASVKYKHGATVTLPTVNSQGTCIFKGWSVNDSTDLLPNGATFVMPTRATTVTGVWEYDGKYTVVYDQGFEGEQQTGPTDSTVYHAGEAVTLAQNDPDAGGFVREGYIFLGWSTTPGHTYTGFRPGQQVVLDNWIDVGVVTLYAVWGPQVNVSTPITPALTLMVKPDNEGMTGTLSESLAANANFFQSQTPENVLVSSIQCAPIEGANGTKNVFVDEELWPFISVNLTAEDGSQVDLPISEATSLRSFSMADDNKFIIPANSGLPISVDMTIPRYVQIAIEQANVQVARLMFTFQLTGEESETIVPESAQVQA